jgi:hypothetical protein
VAFWLTPKHGRKPHEFHFIGYCLDNPGLFRYRVLVRNLSLERNMRVVLLLVGVFSFLAAIVVILLHVAGYAAQGSSAFWSVFGCFIIGGDCLDRAFDRSGDGGRQAKKSGDQILLGK